MQNLNQTLEKITDLEKQLIESVYHNKPDILKAIIAPDAIFVSGKHGYVSVNALISGLANHPKVLHWEINNVRCIDQSEHLMIILYESKQTLADNIHLAQYSTSIWKKPVIIGFYFFIKKAISKQ